MNWRFHAGFVAAVACSLSSCGGAKADDVPTYAFDVHEDKIVWTTAYPAVEALLERDPTTGVDRTILGNLNATPYVRGGILLLDVPLTPTGYHLDAVGFDGTGRRTLLEFQVGLNDPIVWMPPDADPDGTLYYNEAAKSGETWIKRLRPGRAADVLLHRDRPEGTLFSLDGEFLYLCDGTRLPKGGGVPEVFSISNIACFGIANASGFFTFINVYYNKSTIAFLPRNLASQSQDLLDVDRWIFALAVDETYMYWCEALKEKIPTGYALSQYAIKRRGIAGGNVETLASEKCGDRLKLTTGHVVWMNDTRLRYVAK